MARSEDAIKRRAEKRQRTEEEQRQAEKHDMRKQQMRAEGLDEPGAWLCPQCGNHNYASRSICNSKTCTQRRPSSSSSPHRPVPRHDPSTSKTHIWAEQADRATLERNQELRRRYLEDPEGMEPEEVERAKLLIARDERKQLKKQQSKTSKTASSESSKEEERKDPKPPKRSSPNQEDDRQTQKRKKRKAEDAKDKPRPLNRKEMRKLKKENKELRERYLNGAKGMEPEEIERAKILISRDERKRVK